MTSLVGTVLKNLERRECIGKRLIQKGCRVSLKDVPQPHLIINLDKIELPRNANEKRCDYLFFAENANGHDWVIPIEMKGGRINDADDLVKQLSAGARAAEKLLSSYHSSVQFIPIAVSKGIPTDVRIKLKNAAKEIYFLKKLESVRCMSCGAPLMNFLRK